MRLKLGGLFAAGFFSIFWITLSSASGVLSLDVNKDSEVRIESLIPPLLPPSSNAGNSKFVYIVQVEDELGRVVFLEYRAGQVQGIVQVLSIIWRPDSEGTYTVKSHVWSDLEHPEPRDSLVGERRIDVDEETRVFCAGSALCFTGVVTKIVDGDTLDVDDTRIRLSLVDTPEVGEVGYDDAAEFTSELCFVGSSVVVDQDDGQLMDDFDRMLAKVTCEGGLILNAELFKSNHGEIMTEYCAQSEFSKQDWARQKCQDNVAPTEPTPSAGIISDPPEEDRDCDPSYPEVCIPSPPPDLECGDITYRDFRVVGSDPHRFDGDNDGRGCES